MVSKYLELLLGAVIIFLLALVFFSVKSHFNTPVFSNFATLLYPILTLFLIFAFHAKYSEFSILIHIKTYLHFSISIIFIVLTVILMHAIGLLYIQPNYVKTSINFTAAVEILLTQLIVASSEELIFRGLLFLGLIIRSKNLFLSAFLSSLLFSAIHFQNYSISKQWFIHLGIISIGMVMCYLYIYCKSIWPPIIFHFLNNFVVDVFEFPKNMIGTYFVTDITQTIVIVIIAIAFTIFLSRLDIKHLVQSFLSKPVLINR